MVFFGDFGFLVALLGCFGIWALGFRVFGYFCTLLLRGLFCLVLIFGWVVFGLAWVFGVVLVFTWWNALLGVEF